MEAYEYKVMRLLEDTYWWYRGLHQLMSESAYLILNRNSTAKILDAGCGTGGNMQTLKSVLPTAEISGIDISYSAVMMANQRGVGQVSQGSVEHLPYGEETFDLIVSSDVLYFKGLNDKKALSEFYRVLKHEGSLILNLPAYEFLKGAHDLAVSTGRRYVKSRVRGILEETGFKVSKLMYWNITFFLFLAVWRPLTRFFPDKGTPRSDLRPLPSFVNKLLTKYIFCEIRAAQQFSFPFGSSIFVVAKKR